MANPCYGLQRHAHERRALAHNLSNARLATRCGHGWRTLEDVIDPALPATQSLERGSSVTHNSLVANQRAHISLIDRRHSGPAAFPIEQSPLVTCLRCVRLWQ